MTEEQIIQKAKELVDKFRPFCTYDDEGLVIPVAKSFAIICVDEIIKSRPYSPINIGEYYELTYDRIDAAIEF